MNDLPQRIRWGIFLVLLGLSVLLMVLDSTGNLDNAFSFLQNPLAGLLEIASTPATALAERLAGPADLVEARAEIARLQAENDAMERELEQLREIQGEYQILLDLFNQARETPDLRRVTATVIGSDTSLAVRSIIIDKGTNDGVQVGMPVEGTRGLVGQVFRVTADSAQVVLITDSASSIPARLGDSRATGLLRGGGLGGSMTIEWIDLQYQVAVGEVVMTSGLGGKFPQDMVIGRVIDVERSEAELFQQATVQAAVDFEALEIVFVVTGFAPVNTDIFGSPVDGQ
ncbi:MAG: rod shape-determining protein MreC [Ardenticatenaceae bacterium]|nr:rod shape-determining protein MreC [Ardenticatenaceae bacterium]